MQRGKLKFHLDQALSIFDIEMTQLTDFLVKTFFSNTKMVRTGKGVTFHVLNWDNFN